MIAINARAHLIAVIGFAGFACGTSEPVDSLPPFPGGLQGEVPPDDGSGTPAGSLRIHNDSDETIALALTPLGDATIDARVLTRSLDLEIPDQAFKGPSENIVVEAHATLDVSSPIFVVDSEGRMLPEPGAILTRGESALYVGAGTLRTRRVDGKLRLVPEDSSRVRVVPIRRDVKTCAVNAKPTSFPLWTSDEIGKTFRVSATRTAGCTTARLEEIGAENDAARMLSFCGPEEAWPFSDGDRVMMSLPHMIGVGRVEGLRLDRTQQAGIAAFEIANVQPLESPFPFGKHRITTTNEDTSCVLLPDVFVERGCTAVGLQASARDRDSSATLSPSTPIQLAEGRAWIVGVTARPISFDCAGPMPSELAVVASYRLP